MSSAGGEMGKGTAASLVPGKGGLMASTGVSRERI